MTAMFDLTDSDGPRVTIRLPDEQVVDGTARRRRHDPGPAGGWWYQVELAAWGVERGPEGVARAVPAPITMWVPAEVCTPQPGEDYSSVPTDRPGRGAPAWLLEQLPDAPEGDGLRVHRGDCAAPDGTAHPASPDLIHRALTAGASRCTVCSPPAP
ncbi:DUF6233 domain-containing protein [Streptomyces xiamenensis]|uniref:DUF6233 domain-containing protein n=1 Tax=Streptomyces xiamenensis TaxID=408015 RepID=UPI0036E7CA00